MIAEAKVITRYLQAALGKAHYEIVEDDQVYYGEIPGFEGIWATATTLEACRDELEDVLESWILFRVHKHLQLPEVDGLNLVIHEVA